MGFIFYVLLLKQEVILEAMNRNVALAHSNKKHKINQ